MPSDRFMIASYEIGKKSDQKPWILPEAAFEQMDNAYIWRGRIRKRFGERPMNESVPFTEQQYHTRLRVLSLDATDDTGSIAAGAPIGHIWAQGQMFSITDPISGITVSYTVNSNIGGVQPMLTDPLTTIVIGQTDPTGSFNGIAPGGIYAPGQQFEIAGVMFTTVFGVGPTPMNRLPAGGLVHTFDVATGAIVITGEAPNTDVIYHRGLVNAGTFNITTGDFTITNSFAFAPIEFYPSTPVMGFLTYQTGLINSNETFAFDQQFSYQYIAGAWERLGLKEWTGTNEDYFSGANWNGVGENANILYVVNNVIADQIQYWDGAAWTALHPLVGGGHHLDTCKILVIFKNRLVALNTIEDGVNFFNRARWSQFGSPIDPAAWNDDIPGRGSFSECPVKEQIITATIIKDHLIVYFDSSTYELVYTNNEFYPFRWQQINSELGAESVRSIINLDSNAFGIGPTGIHSCNGITVERIDQDIPDDVYDIFANDEGTRRVCGIRDFQPEMVYWAIPFLADFPFDNNTFYFPNKVLAYNYKNGSWSYFDDNITAFGYYYRQDARTWVNMNTDWGSCDQTWGGPDFQSRPKIILCGNQEGWTFLVDSYYSKNSMSLSITDIDPATLRLTVINHNLPTFSYVFIQNCTGLIDFNDGIYQVIPLTKDILTLQLHPGQVPPGGQVVYTGGGTITLVSQVDILTKQFNFYIKQNRNAAINKIDFLVDSNPGGKLMIECFPSYSRNELVDSAIANGSILGTSVLEMDPYAAVPLETYQDQFWHPLYFNAEGESVQFELFYSPEQMIDPDIAFAGLQIQAMTIYTNPTAYRTS